MRFIYMVMVLVVAACTNTDEASEAGPQQAVSTNPLHWMVGAWSCPAPNTGYHGIPPFVAHNATATYDVTEDARGIVHGTYHELSADGRPLVDFTDEWSVGSIPDGSGNVQATYQMKTSDGFTASAAGTIHGSSGPAVAGASSFEGSLEFPDGSVHSWHASSIETLNTGTMLSSNYSLGSLGSKLLYFGMQCTPVAPPASTPEPAPPSDMTTSQVAVTSSAVRALLNHPRPTPEFQFCDGFVTCNPLEDGLGDFNCTLDCLEPAWCPAYTAAEWNNCQNHPFSSGCCSDSGLDGIPCFPKRCIKGERP